MNKISSKNSPTWIVRDADGVYRWTYEITGENSSMLKTYMIIFALIILIPGFILMFMIYGSRGYWSGAGGYLAIWMAIFLGVELLTVGIYKAVEKARGGSNPMPYAMTDELIMVHSDVTHVHPAYLQTKFSDVINITVNRNDDLILLNELMRVTHVYVPREDFDFVLNFIRSRVPNGDRIRM